MTPLATCVYTRLMRLYPDDIQFAYGAELIAEFNAGLADGEAHGRLRSSIFVLRRVARLVFEAGFERFHSLCYSHRSFHGRRRPDLSLVRPPTMSKQEWFSLGGDNRPDRPDA